MITYWCGVTEGATAQEMFESDELKAAGCPGDKRRHVIKLRASFMTKLLQLHKLFDNDNRVRVHV